MQSSCKLELIGVLKLSLWPVCMTRAKLLELTRESFSNHFPFELMPIFFLIYCHCPVHCPFIWFFKKFRHCFPPLQTALIYLPWETTPFSPNQLGHFYYKTRSFLCKLQLSLQLIEQDYFILRPGGMGNNIHASVNDKSFFIFRWSKWSHPIL